MTRVDGQQAYPLARVSTTPRNFNSSGRSLTLHERAADSTRFSAGSTSFGGEFRPRPLGYRHMADSIDLAVFG
jgi:hypothetical protein